jgi:Protein of unknown function (DUF1553)/Protein of unknown function (DUF1549)/Concanavalin A-like lectin/glucanases superfamily/Planctomycete cytochrome C
MRHLAPLVLFPILATQLHAVEFNRDVLPILSDKCFTCHGPDAAAKKIPFRLDSEAAAKAVLADGRHAIVAGDPQTSELVRRIVSDKKSALMPPVYSGLSLSKSQIDILTTWIQEGAKWQQHWSFIPPQRPALPPVKNQKWIKNPIDAFVLARLEKEGLVPSPEANPTKLIRRVTLDLTGLPPTPAEIDAFLNDTAPDAYAKVVDRLLASPRYGERMAARWLDAARYADSNGYQYDAERVMWRWRDWVINAFNRNQPFNQFTLEQIAGDLLPKATLDQKIATAFNRNHRANTEDGIIPEEYAVEYVVDRVETTSTVFMGATLGCARCHNHKYDPFTQKEFYQVFAYFNNVPELGRAMKYGNSPPMIPAPTAAQQAKLNELDQHMQVFQKFLDQNSASIQKAQSAWEKETASAAPVYWTPKEGLEAAFPMEGGEAGRINQAQRFDGKTSIDEGDKAGFDIEDRFSISAWIYSDDVPDGSVVSRMEDNIKGKGYGLHVNHGRVHIGLTSIWADDAIRLETEETLAPKRWYNLLLTYSGSRMAEGVHLYIDGKPAKLKVELDTLYRPFRNAGKPVKDPLRIGGGWGPDRRFHGLIDDIRIYRRLLTSDEISTIAAGTPLSDSARKSAAERSSVDRYQLRAWFLENAASQPVRDAWSQWKALQQQREEMERTFPTVMVMAERPERKDTFILMRGAYNVHGDKVEPGVPAVLPPLPAGAPNNRLGFAEWLIDAKNPLLARVTVNRFWQMYFGTGIVKTIEDFGRQGEWPAHPELLDWLATEFIRTGWDVKAMQKLIVTSAAYRQASEASPELEQRDPDNRLLARGPRSRLPAEMIHDQALFAAGLLVEKIGGPSVKPYQPDGLWREISMQDMDYTQGHGEDLYRRSLYTYWKRTVAPPMLANFDSALRESCVVRESRTNTPLQALNLMNDITFVEAAKFIGQRMMKEGGADTDARLRYGFRLVTGRAPSPQEEEILRGTLLFHRDYFASKPEDLDHYLKQGESAPDPKLNRLDLASYAAVGSLLLNLDETITKE